MSRKRSPAPPRTHPGVYVALVLVVACMVAVFYFAFIDIPKAP
jgi:hypothetical protein